jgi:hypothetical protein
MKQTTNDFGVEVFEPEMVGGMTGRELPGIVDHVFSMSLFDCDEKGIWVHNPKEGKIRAFVTQTINPWGLPAKTRSDNLDLVEQPNLGKLLEKINQPARAGAAERQFEITRPATAA